MIVAQSSIDLSQLIPIAAFWAGANVILSVCKVINQMRDTVILGKIENESLSEEHGDIMILDYKLVTFGAILATWAFAFMFWCAASFSSGILFFVWLVLGVVQFWHGIGFIWCGRKDLAAMNSAADKRRSSSTDGDG